MIKKLLKIAVEKKASDIHLVTGLPPTVRIHGNLVSIEGYKEINDKEMQQMVFSILSPEQKEKFIKTKELDMGYELDPDTRFRINIHYEKGYIGLVGRVIQNEMPDMEAIEMPKLAYDLLNKKQGLILVTGPTGCGKSTTLAAMINHINKSRSCSIITLEDPIEFMFTSDKSIIIQRQLGSDMLSFEEGLKHVLRQDPNVVMVGEMRDLETIATTITLAETGHLVLATLHTYSAAQTIDRVIDIFPPHQQNQIRMQLANTLLSVISQRLMPKADGSGRVSAREIMLNNPAVANLIRENKIAQIKTVIETSSRDGMISLDRDIKRLVNEKIVDEEIARNQMANPESL